MKRKLVCFVIVLSIILTLIGLSTAKGKEITVSIDGNGVNFPDVKPFIDENSRTLIPVRFVSESLGAVVEWNKEDREVDITLDEKHVRIRIGDRNIVANKRIVQMDTKAIIKEDRTFVPIRFVVEALGGKVEWDAVNYRVVIITRDAAATPTPTASPLPTEWGDVNEEETEEINGYVVPKNRISVIYEPYESTGAEISMSLFFTHPEKEPIDRQWDEVYFVLMNKFGEDIADEVLNHIKDKIDRYSGFKMKTFKLRDGKEISVIGEEWSWSASIIVYK